MMTLISALEMPVACLWVWPTFGGAVLLDLLADQPWVKSFSSGIASVANRSTCCWRRS